MGNAVWIATEVLFAIIYILLVYLFLRILLKNRNKPLSLLNTIVILASTAMFFCARFFLSDNIAVFGSISILITFVLGISLFHVKPKHVILPTIFIFLAGAIFEMLAVFAITAIYRVSLEEMIQFNMYRIQLVVLTYLFYPITLVLLNRFVNMRVDSISMKLTMGLCVLPLVSVFITFQFLTNVVMEMQEPTISEVITLISIIIANIFVFVLVDSLVKKNEQEQALLLIKAQGESHRQHIQHLVSTHEQIRKMSHDYKHDIGVLHALCEQQDYDALLSNINELSDKSNSYQLIDTKNIMLDAILTSKKGEAGKLGIDFYLKLDVQPNLSYISLAHCSLLGNSLDNAIEACCRSSEDGGFIDLELAASSSVFMFRVKNTLDEMPVPKENGKFFITKKGDKLRHGLGLQSMKQTVDELGGELKYEYDKEQFMIWVYVPIEGMSAD